VGFPAATATSVKITVVWVAAPCSLVEVCGLLRGACCFLHQCKRRSCTEDSYLHIGGISSSATNIHTCVLIAIIHLSHLIRPSIIWGLSLFFVEQIGQSRSVRGQKGMSESHIHSYHHAVETVAKIWFHIISFGVGY
jgi:hypothetical protein